MNRKELTELLQNGENSGVEFKRDDVSPERLAARITALLNLEGGYVLLGVEDDGSISGLTRESNKAEEWVMQIARDHIDPAFIPYWEPFAVEDKLIGIISLHANAPDKPYKAKRGSAWVTYIRAGTTTRLATREEEERLYQQAGRLIFGLKPVPGTTLESFDKRRLHDYFVRVVETDTPPFGDVEQWERLLQNMDFATSAAGHIASTVDGLLLFGQKPGRFLPQSGIRALCYPGDEPDYAARADEYIKGPLVSLSTSTGLVFEPGLVDSGWDFVRRNTTPTAWLERAQRYQRWEYPESVVRELLVNALVHRDYSISGTDVTLTIYSNRLEIESPGRLPNTVTIEGMKSGLRYARNQTLVNVMRDYGYVEGRGMGVRKKVLPGMQAHNGTEPEFIEEDYRFIVRLWKEPRS